MLRTFILLSFVTSGMLRAEELQAPTTDTGREPSGQVPRSIQVAEAASQVQADTQEVRDWLIVGLRLIRVTGRPDRIAKVDPDDVFDHHSEYGRVVTGTEQVLPSVNNIGVTTFTPDDGMRKSHQYLVATADGDFERAETEPTEWRNRMKIGSTSMTDDGRIQVSDLDVIATTILNRKRVAGLPLDIAYAGEPTLSTERFVGTIDVPVNGTAIRRTKVVDGVAEPDSPGNFWLLVRTRTVHGSRDALRKVLDESRRRR